MDAPPDTIACFRCGYDLRGVDDEAACPECGLLAGRSRPATSRLRDANPAYLRRVSVGVWLILVTLPMPLVLVPLLQGGSMQLSIGSIATVHALLGIPDLVAVIFGTGVWLLSDNASSPSSNSSKSMETTDSRTGRRLQVLQRLHRLWQRLWHRLWQRLAALRRLAFLPLAIVLVGHLEWFLQSLRAATGIRYTNIGGAVSVGLPYYGKSDDLIWTILCGLFILQCVAATIGAAVLSLLIFLRLRDLGRRLLSRQLTEYSAIVGWGAAGSILFCAAVVLLSVCSESLGIPDRFFYTSSVWLLAMLAVLTGITLFWGWAVCVLIGFAVSFWREGTALRRAWRRADRGAVAGA